MQKKPRKARLCPSFCTSSISCSYFYTIHHFWHNNKNHKTFISNKYYTTRDVKMCKENTSKETQTLSKYWNKISKTIEIQTLYINGETDIKWINQQTTIRQKKQTESKIRTGKKRKEKKVYNKTKRQFLKKRHLR